MSDKVDFKKWRKYGHRTRRRRFHRAVVLDASELAELLECDLGDVERELEARGMDYHKDSTGEI